jgi:hypothetical protein
MSTDWLGCEAPVVREVNVSRQPVHAAEPVLVMRIRAVKPELHVVVVYATRQAKPGPPVVGVVNVTVPDRGDDGVRSLAYGDGGTPTELR